MHLPSRLTARHPSLPAFRTTQISRAVRRGLAMTPVLMALSWSSAALAGTCHMTAPDKAACDGVFQEGLDEADFPGAADLTVELGANAPTVVTPPERAVGVDLDSQDDRALVNHGEITTIGAPAVRLRSGADVSLVNHGDISTSSGGQVHVDPMVELPAVELVTSGGTATFENFGSIRASESNELLLEGLAGIHIRSHDGHGLTSGDIYVTNQAGATVEVVSTGQDRDDGMFWRSMTGIRVDTLGEAHVLNEGTVSVQRRPLPPGSSPTFAIDVDAGEGGTLHNSGSILGGGVRFVGGSLPWHEIRITNSGTVEGLIVARSDFAHDVFVGNSGTAGDLYATGLVKGTIINSGTAGQIWARGDQVSVINSGVSRVAPLTTYSAMGLVATTPGNTALARQDLGGVINLSVENSGLVDVTASAIATGILAHNGTRQETVVVNSGSVFAQGPESATGVSLYNSGVGTIDMENTGQIVATGDRAVGVLSWSESVFHLVNTGTISAKGGAGGSFALAVLDVRFRDKAGTGDGMVRVDNSGTLRGAIETGNGDDLLSNAAAGQWHVVGASTFSGGDDRIDNAGFIGMTDASIDLGGSTQGNRFDNSGRIFVSGLGNSIHMGQAGTSPANVFENDGLIDFGDGTTDDALLVRGTFGGTGRIAMDADLATGASDALRIEGDVLEGSVQVIDVDVQQLAPPGANALVTLVEVTGNSTTGNFVLSGLPAVSPDVFVDTILELFADIDTSNARPDLFSLRYLNRLADAGTLATSLLPGAHGLMTAQVGTWRQRAGVLQPGVAGVFTPWIRTFRDRGDVAPTADLVLVGDAGFERENQGIEAGVEFALTDRFDLGVLVAKSEGRQAMHGSSAFSELDADTYGVYATWAAPGAWYVDASYRWMAFDARLHTATGDLGTDGKLQAFNVEAGYAWRFANGVALEPQLQYTRIDTGDVAPIASGSSTFQVTSDTATRGRVGLMLRKGIGSAAGTLWTPFVTASAVRDFDANHHYQAGLGLGGDVDTEGSSTLVEAGLDVRTGNLSVFAGLNWQDGGAYEGVAGGQVGVRYRFGGAAGGR